MLRSVRIIVMDLLIYENAFQRVGAELGDVTPVRVQADGALLRNGGAVEAEALKLDAAYASPDIFRVPAAARGFFRAVLKSSTVRWLQSGAAGLDDDLGALGGRQHHDAHDALGVHPAAVAGEPDFALETAGELRELGRGARMQAELVDDFNFPLLHCSGSRVTCGRPPRRRRTRPC